MKNDLQSVNCLIKGKEYEKALKLLYNTIFEDTEGESVCFLKAMCHLRTCNYVEAEKYFNKLSDKSSTKEIEYYKLLCKFKTAKYEDIIKYHILNKDLNNDMKFLIAASYEKINLFQNAKILYEEVSKADGLRIQSLNNLSLLDNEFYRFKLAYNYSDKRKPGYYEVANNMANGYIQKGMENEGLGIFEEIYEDYKKMEVKDDKINNVVFNYLKALIKCDKLKAAKIVGKEVKKICGNKNFANYVKLFNISILIKLGKLKKAKKKAEKLAKKSGNVQISSLAKAAVENIGTEEESSSEESVEAVKKYITIKSIINQNEGQKSVAYDDNEGVEKEYVNKFLNDIFNKQPTKKDSDIQVLEAYREINNSQEEKSGFFIHNPLITEQSEHEQEEAKSDRQPGIENADQFEPLIVEGSGDEGDILMKKLGTIQPKTQESIDMNRMDDVKLNQDSPASREALDSSVELKKEPIKTYVFKTSLKKEQLDKDTKDYISSIPRIEKKSLSDIASRQKKKITNSLTMNKRAKTHDDENFNNCLFYSFDSEMDNTSQQGNNSSIDNEGKLYKRIKQEKSHKAHKLNNTSLHNINDSLVEKMNIYDNKYRRISSSYKLSTPGSISTIEQIRQNERQSSEKSDNDIVVKGGSGGDSNKESIDEDKDDLQDLYSKALDRFKDADYTNAKEMFGKIRKIDKTFNDSSIAIMMGKIYLENSEFKKAISEYEKFPKSHNIESVRNLISCYQKLDMTKNFKNILCYYSENNPYEEDIIKQTVESCIYLSDNDNVMKFCEMMLEFEGKQFKGYVKVIKLLFANNCELLDYIHNLLDKLNVIIKGEDQENEFYLLTGRYMLKKKNTALAFDYFSKINEDLMQSNMEYFKYFGKTCLIMKNYKKAIKLFKKALNLEKSSWEISLYIGESYLKLDNYEGALKYLTYSQKKEVNFTTNLKLNLSLGRLYYKQKNYMQALDHFFRCTQIDAQCYKAYHHIAMIFLEKREFNEAEKVLEKAYEITDQFFPVLFELFKLKCLLKKESECHDYIPKIEKFIDMYPMCYLDLAKTLLESFSNIDQSSKYLSLALTKDKNIKNSFNINKVIEYANYLYNNLDEKERSYEVLNSLLATNENNYYIYKKLNQLYLLDNHIDKAISNLNKFIEIDKQHYEAKKDLADLYYTQKDYSKAMLTYEEAIICFNKQDTFIHTDAYKRMAICEVRLELYDSAVEHLCQQLSHKDDKRIYLLIAYIKYVILERKEEAEKYYNV
jgi:tetratricopeptide (TPR) repeat protein